MTTYQLQHRFNLEMERNGIFEPIMSLYVQDYINWAYQEYITEKYDSLINPVEKFEVTERISRILAPLLYDFSATSFSSLTTNSPYGFYCNGPTDLQYLVSEKAIINTTNCDGTAITRIVRIVPIKHNLINTNKDNPFLKPNDDEIWRLNFSGNKLELILKSGQTLSSYTCRYLKKQVEVDLINEVTMEVDSSVHEEIVVRAAYKFLGQPEKKNKNETT